MVRSESVMCDLLLEPRHRSKLRGSGFWSIPTLHGRSVLCRDQRPGSEDTATPLCVSRTAWRVVLTRDRLVWSAAGGKVIDLVCESATCNSQRIT